MSMKNSIDTIGIRNRDLPTCSTVPQPTVSLWLFHKIKIRIKKSHIYAVIPHVSQLTSPTDSILSTSERTNRCSYLFLMKKREKFLIKQRHISQIQLLSPYVKIFLLRRHFSTLSHIYPFVTYLTRLSINQFTQRQMVGWLVFFLPYQQSEYTVFSIGWCAGCLGV